MIKLVIFDLDGVLVDAREIHYHALNKALEAIDPKYIIHRNEHLSTYDGLPTTKKLNMLTQNKELPPELHDTVWALKQEKTIELLKELKYDKGMCRILEDLVDDGYQIYVASNSIRDSVKMMLFKTGLLEYVHYYISNQDVNIPKPHTEMYLRCFIHAGVNPHECVIVEDSHNGRKAAIESGGYLCGVEDPDDVSYEKIKAVIDKANKETDEKEYKPKWQGGSMNVLIPMAGAGKRFQEAGYSFPKPLIEVNGKPMIQLIVENLNIDARHIFVVQKEHYDEFSLQHLLNLISPGCEIVFTEGVTEGATCTTLLTKHLIDNDDHLLIANSDQFMEWDSNEFLYSMCADEIDGGILTFRATHPKWSYVKLNEEGFVSEVAEKKVISDIANVGVYYWKYGSDYVRYAEQMIEKDIRINGEFYVAPVYNEALDDGKKIKNFDVNGMWGLGTPEDLQHFQKNYGG